MRITTPTVQGLAPLSIHLKNHCILCLQPESPTILQTNSSPNASSILSFQPLVYYLTAIDPSDPSQMSEYIQSQKYFPICTSHNLPPMCASCYKILGKMYRLHSSLIQIQQQLQKQIQLARKIVKSTVNEDNGFSTRLSARTDLFRKMGSGLTSLLSPEDMKRLRYFIENFHGLIIQAENTYKFPSPPAPPPDPHLPPPPTPVSQAALMSLSYPVKFEWPIPQPNYLSTSTSDSPAPSASSSSTSNHDVILVSGIDETVNFQVEDADDREDDNIEDEPVNVVIHSKPNQTTTALQDKPQQFIVEPDEYPSEEDEEEEVAISQPATLSQGGVGGNGVGGNIMNVDKQPCDICNKVFDLFSLHAHLRGHLSRDPVSCDVCRQVFLSKSKLINHYTDMNTGLNCRLQSRWYRTLRYSCELCNGSNYFRSEMDLKNHIFSVHERDPGLRARWECNLCKERYKTFEGLDFHTNIHVSLEQRRNCWERLKNLLPPPSWPSTTPMPSSSSTTAFPTNSANRWRGDDLTCEICGKQCIGNSALLKHVKQVHKNGGAAKRPRN